jgi:hypothetical protein
MKPLFITIVAAALAGAAFAADTPAETKQNLPAALSPKHNDGYLSLFFDNDTFGGTDENYTNGVRLSWISPSLPVDRLSGFHRNLDWLLHRIDWQGGNPWLYQYGISLTQLMFTPEDIATSTLIPDDRPYAGWLGLGFSLHAKTDSLLHSLELSVGVVGRPRSRKTPRISFTICATSTKRRDGTINWKTS